MFFLFFIKQVIFRALNPQIPVKNPYSEKVQNLLKLTNIRINFTKLHTLGDLVLDPTKPDTKWKYYYAVYDLVIRGSCSCYGHAEQCLPLPGEASVPGMVSALKSWGGKVWPSLQVDFISSVLCNPTLAAVFSLTLQEGLGICQRVGGGGGVG